MQVLSFGNFLLSICYTEYRWATVVPAVCARLCVWTGNAKRRICFFLCSLFRLRLNVFFLLFFSLGLSLMGNFIARIAHRFNHQLVYPHTAAEAWLFEQWERWHHRFTASLTLHSVLWPFFSFTDTAIYRRIYRYCINFVSGRQNAFLFSVCLLSFCRFNFLLALLVVMLLASIRRRHNHNSWMLYRSKSNWTLWRERVTAAYIPFWKREQTKKEKNKYTEEQISAHTNTIFVFFFFARFQHPMIIINRLCR